MLTYNEYYIRMNYIQDILNSVSDHLALNVSGMTQKETVLYVFGKYMQALSAATMPYFHPSKCAQLIALLIHIKRNLTEKKHFDFSMFSVDDVEHDEELADLWQHDFIDYTRMSSTVFVGAAYGIISDTVIDDLDMDWWSNIQAAHLAKYFVAHDVDISKIIALV